MANNLHVIMKKLILTTVTVCCLLLQGITQSQRVTIPGSELRKIQSTIIGQEYDLHIFLPGGYTGSTKTYPVLYLMDSQWDFPLAACLYGEQYYDGFIPQMIIVGVTWGGERPNPDSLRVRDYTPTKTNGAPQSGGASTFLSFMRKELFPFIESNYRADKSNRTLMGCSLGGLFTLYALFTEPDMFNGYVAASPAFGWDREAIYKYEQAYFDKHPDEPERLYMSMGGVERGVPGFEKLVKHLGSRNYKNVQIKTRVLDNIGHSGTKAEGYARGMQYVYERHSLVLDVAVLNKYVGKYGNFEIKNENNQLTFYAGPNNKFTLYAASESDFYSTSEFLYVRFKTDDGKVTGLQLEGFNNSRFVPKS
jgi:predicted alpha/beta superfamily hydrolase